MPEFPDELGYVWEWFRKLAARRQSGMAPNPLRYQDVEAFERRTLVRLTAWETDLLIRLDDAVLAVWADGYKAPASASLKSEPIEAGDTVNMKSMFRGLATLKKQQLAGKKGGRDD